MGNDSTAGAATTTVGGDGDLYAGLMEESDLPDISALLVEARNVGSSFVQTAVFTICGNPSPMWAILACGWDSREQPCCTERKPSLCLGYRC